MAPPTSQIFVAQLLSYCWSSETFANFGQKGHVENGIMWGKSLRGKDAMLHLVMFLKQRKSSKMLKFFNQMQIQQKLLVVTLCERKTTIGTKIPFEKISKKTFPPRNFSHLDEFLQLLVNMFMLQIQNQNPFVKMQTSSIQEQAYLCSQIMCLPFVNFLAPGEGKNF